MIRLFADARRVFVLVCLACLMAAPVHAATRVALVIGNSDYDTFPKLKNPRNDAEDVAAVLRDLDFEVVAGNDLTKTGFQAKIRDFSKALAGAEVALLFYAGHAIQVDGVNYIVPKDSQIEAKADLDFETVSLDFVLRQMEREAKTILVFLDACRDNPLSRGLARSIGGTQARGLARVSDASDGMFIAFATSPNNVALDGEDRNSPFTSALLKHIRRPNVEISELMTDVRLDVYKATDQKQLPFTSSGLLGKFYFKKQDGDDELAGLRAQAAEWRRIEASEDPRDFAAFIEAHPGSLYLPLARDRMAKLSDVPPVAVAKVDDSKATSTAIRDGRSVDDLSRAALAAYMSGDIPAATTLYGQAADKGHAPSMHAIARIHELGIGMPANAELARQWYRRAADSGWRASAEAIKRVGG